jgi:hypothetical protein
MTKHLWLAKANDNLVSFCACGNSLISSPPQLDCPWCGCGWLFSCIKCRKAFTFAKVVEIDQSLEQLARRDLFARSDEEPSREQIDEWVAFMKDYLRDVKPGEEYVAFDGRVVATSMQRLDFDGWHATHQLNFIPQVAALADPSVRTAILNSEDYWQSHALGDFSPSALGQPAIRDREKKWWQFWK